MPDEKRCGECGAVLPAESPQGLCPACLLKRGLATEPSARTEYIPPTPGELARFFPELEILELIGRGGMGAVYKARQKQLDRLVALKILPGSVKRDPAFAERFAREARALARLQHPHIVAVHDSGQADGLFYFVMEFVDGMNLRQLLNAGKLAPKEALAIVPQICEALQYAHDKGIVHRDIKPENLLIDKTGTVKIADFGLAKLVGLEAKDLRITGSGDVMGTPHYMAPEQVEHPQDVDHRADIYSLGVVFYQMLTGELPIGRFAPPSRKVQIDVRLDKVVLRALEKEPEHRYQHASEVKTQVETIAASVAPGRISSQNESASSFPNWLLWRIGLPKGKAPSTGQSPCLSAAAMGGASWAGLFSVTMIPWLVRWIIWKNTVVHGPSWFALIWSLPTLLGLTAMPGTTILGWVAVSQIRRSAGKIYGLGLAVFDGLLFPLLALDGLILGLWFVVLKLVAVWLNYRHFQPWDGRGFDHLLITIWALLTVPTSAWVDWLIVRRVWRAMSRPVADDARVPTPVSSERQPTDGRTPTITAVFPMSYVLTYTVGFLLGTIFMVSGMGNRGSFWTLMVFALAALGSPVMSYFVLRLGKADTRRVFLRAGSVLAVIVSLPIVGFALFFLHSFASSGFKWNPAPDESVIVSVIWLGAVLLPFCGWRLCRAAKQQRDDAVISGAERHARLKKLFLVQLPIVVVVVLVVRAFFLQPFRAATDAAAPEIPRGSRFLVWKLNHDFAPGDLIAYRHESWVSVGRVLRSEAETVWVNRNGEAEAAVPRVDILGSVISVYWRASSEMSSAIATFGPVIERVITVGNDGRSFYSFDRGDYVPGPASFEPADGKNNGQLWKWMTANHVDVFARARDGRPVLMRSEMVSRDLNEDDFERLTPAKLAANDGWESALNTQFRAQESSTLGRGILRGSKDTLAFQTRYGVIGLVQVVGVTSDPPGVKIRYKLVQNPTTTVPLPPGYKQGQEVPLPPGYERGQPPPSPPAYRLAQSGATTWSRLSPFTEVVCHGDNVKVWFEGQEYELVSINDLTSKQILDYCHREFGDRWEMRFAEDLVEVLAGMGNPMTSDQTVKLVLKAVGGDRSVTIEHAPMTHENRHAVKRERAAMSAMQDWLALMDAGAYAQSWETAANSFHKATTKNAWVKLSEEVRRPLGAPTRKEMTTQSSPAVPGMARGSYFVAQFATSFAAETGAVETVVFMQETDGQWRAISYVIRPRTAAQTAAVTAAQSWLEGIDAGHYAENRTDASEFFRNTLSQDKWVQTLESFRSPLGKLEIRTVDSAVTTTTLPGVPYGEYIVMQFHTSFANTNRATETVTFSPEKDGQWRASGYYIK